MALAAVAGVVSELVLLSFPLCAAVLLGLLLGWAWRPRWAAEVVGGDKAKSNGSGSSLRSFSLGAFDGSGSLLRLPGLDSLRCQLPGCVSPVVSNERAAEGNIGAFPSSSNEERNVEVAVASADLQYLSHLVEVTDGGPTWQPMMNRSLPNMTYQAWRRDPETGPPQYRSRTVYEDVAPEIVRDFFWDDEFRMQAKWDDMLVYHKTLDECTKTGTMIVHWVRKFPFFCNDREYVIGRRIWDCERAYYCVTKGVPCALVPRRNKPRRVDLYYSSWCIRAAESTKGDGQMTACEVLLFHYEDMGIPWEIAKLGVRQGMWGCVKKIEPGLREYQARRARDLPSRSVIMAQVNTKVSAGYLRSLENSSGTTEIEEPQKKTSGRNISKLIVVSGAIALACTLDKGLLTKALIFGVARRFVKMGR